MKLPSTVVIVTCSLMFAGCNQLTQLGSKAMVFEEDPFTQLEQTQAAARQPSSAYPANHQAGNHWNQPALTNQTPNQQYNYEYNQQQAVAQQPGTAVYDPNGALPIQNWDAPPTAATTAAYMPQADAMSGPPASGPVARAEAAVAAMMAQHGRAPKQIQQVGHQAASESPGVATFDFGSFEPQPAPQFGANPFSDETLPIGSGGIEHTYGSIDPSLAVNTTPSNPIVPKPHSPTFELDESLLDLPQAQPPQRNSRVYPGTNIPRPVGRSSVFLDALDDAFEPVQPAPASEPSTQSPPSVVTQPVFTQPVTRGTLRQVGGQTPAVTPAPIPVATPVIVPANPQPAKQPIIHDSTNDSKWRARRRS